MNIKSDNIYFSSDFHYAHQNLCRGVSKWKAGNDDHFKQMTRDFQTLEEMNETLVNNINNTVGEDDVLFHLGDFAFGGFENVEKFRNQIKCKNVHTLIGNHDTFIQNNRAGCQSLFASVNSYVELDLLYKGKTHNLVLMHYPITSWYHMRRGTLMLYGHLHSDFKGPGRTMDVGIDKSPGFKPYHYSEILDIIGNNPMVSGFDLDHHNK